MERTLWLILLALVLIPVGEAVYFHAQLPETIPTHFDGHGRADDWGSKTPYCILAAILPAIVGLVLLPYVFLASPTCIASSLFRLPNKAYWAAPERIEATARFIRRQFVWFNAATMALILVLSHTMLRSAATGRGPTGGQLLIVMGGYLAVVALWMVRFIVHFRAADTTANDNR